MALLDSADLLARCKFHAQRPATDESMTDPNWYSLLSEAQLHWYKMFAGHVPWVLMEAPVLLTSADSGETYTFASSVTPMYLELYEKKDGLLMRPVAYFSDTQGYVDEGDKIRFPKGRSRTFGSGPYARIITPPGVIDGSNEPTLKPTDARLLLVYKAVALWASRGGKRDPKPFLDEMNDEWFGNVNEGKVGVLGALKSRNPFGGSSAFDFHSTDLQSIDDGSGYPTP